MVRFCCVPNCSNRSDRESHLSYFGLPLKNKSLLKKWIHVVCRKNLLINSNTKICSEHFVNAHGRRLYSDEVPSLLLPVVVRAQKARKEPRERSLLLQEEGLDELELEEKDVSTQTEEVDVEVPGELLRVLEHLRPRTPTHTLLGKANYETTCRGDMDPSQDYEATLY